MKKLLLLSLVYAVSLHAAEQDLSKGVDFTGRTSFTPANLNNLVDAAVPASKRGLVIVQTATPDTTNYARLTNYLWLDINYTPALLKSYATGSWVTATIGAGSIAAANLAANAVVAGKIDANAIFTTNINDNAISAAKIIAGAITGGKYFAGSISNADIAVGAVTSDTILDGTIAGVDIAAAAIDGSKIAPGVITYTNLAASAVYGTNIVNGTITSVNIASGGVMLTNIYTNGVTGGTYLRMNAGASALEWATNKFTYTTNWPTTIDSFNGATNAHGLGGMPTSLRLVLVCTSTDGGYDAGDEVDSRSFLVSDGVSNQGAFSFGASTANVYVVPNTTQSTKTVLYILNRGSGALVGATESKWTAKVYVERNNP